jgi:hypothetical protein
MIAHSLSFGMQTGCALSVVGNSCPLAVFSTVLPDTSRDQYLAA